MTSAQPIDAGIEQRFEELRVRLAAMSFPQALAVGGRAADFELPNAQGQRVRLADQLDRGPVVLTFYRGAWCPFCNLQLRSLQHAVPRVQALGASLLAISPELPDGSRAMVEQAALTFEVLSDLHSTVAAAYGITFTDTNRASALPRSRERPWQSQRRHRLGASGTGDLRDEILSALRAITTLPRSHGTADTANRTKEGGDDGHNWTDRPSDGESRKG
jgi:peroxiredoxin